MKIKKMLTLSFLVMGLSLAGVAQSAQVNLSKLRANFENGQTSDFINIYNDSATDRDSFEITVKKWSQSGDKEIYEETNAIVVSPKTVILAPKQSKILRIMINDMEGAKKDYSYRLFVNQLPNKDMKKEVNEVTLLFKVSLPIFINSEPVKPFEKMNIEKSLIKEGGKSYLYVKNLEKLQHVQLQDIKIGEGAEAKIAKYLLPNIDTKVELPINFKVENLLKTPINIGTDKGNWKIDSLDKK
jgi:P pilus assembly chaperone PapD